MCLWLFQNDLPHGGEDEGVEGFGEKPVEMAPETTRKEVSGWSHFLADIKLNQLDKKKIFEKKMPVPN